MTIYTHVLNRGRLGVMSPIDRWSAALFSAALAVKHRASQGAGTFTRESSQ